jgi:hypothetical protein
MAERGTASRPTAKSGETLMKSKKAKPSKRSKKLQGGAGLKEVKPLLNP